MYLQDELSRLRQTGTQHRRVELTNKDDMNEQTKAAASQRQLRDLYDAEQRLRQKFTARLNTASELAMKSPTLYVQINDCCRL